MTLREAPSREESTDMGPYSLLPGPEVILSATSRCMRATCPWQLVRRTRRSMSRGVAAWYGRLATSLKGMQDLIDSPHFYTIVLKHSKFVNKFMKS